MQNAWNEFVDYFMSLYTLYNNANMEKNQSDILRENNKKVKDVHCILILTNIKLPII